MKDEHKDKADRIKLLLTDVDGVLTDNGVFYGESGKVMKRFAMRDGMGVERLRKVAAIETGIVTGELSPSVARRAEKLQITELHLGVKDKLERLNEIMGRLRIGWDEIAYIGDDVNDLEGMEKAGLSACPGDPMEPVDGIVHYHCAANGRNWAFRQLSGVLNKTKNRQK